MHRASSVALYSIIFSRAIYAINWFNIAPAFVAISIVFQIHVGMLGGVLSFAFLIGAGISQIPAGILAVRKGPKFTAMLGMGLLSIFALFSGLTPNVELLVLSRFMVGVGAAMYFSPMIPILTKTFLNTRHGYAMGLYNSAFNLGAGIALLVWAMLVSIIGWRLSLVIGGVIGVVITAENILVIPKDVKLSKPWTQYYKNIGIILKSRNLWYLALGLAGFWGAYFTAAQFLVTYTETAKHMIPLLAGFLASLILFTGVVGGPVMGKISDYIGKRKLLIYISGIIIGLSLFLLPFLSIFGIFTVVALIGFFQVALVSLLYTIPVENQEISSTYLPLAIGLINSIQIMVGAASSFVFGYIVDLYGYTLAWMFLALFGLVLLPLIYLAKGR